jgi:cell division septal protein FtsQ
MQQIRKRRGNSRYFLFFLIALIGIAALGSGVYYLLMNVSWLNIQDVQITGNTSLPDSLITALADSYKGQNILSVTEKEVRQSLSAFARIRDVEVRKHLPGILKVMLRERQGILYLKSTEGDLFPVDGDGLVLERYDTVYREDLPVLTTYFTNAQLKPGTIMKKAPVTKVLALHKAITAQYPEFLPVISEYYMIDNTIHIVDSRYGTRIIPAEAQIADQLRRYLFVQDNGNINRNSLVDLRFARQVVVKEGGK